MNKGFSNYSHGIAKHILTEALRRSLLPISVVREINASKNVFLLEHYKSLLGSVHDTIKERVSVLRKLCEQLDISVDKMLSSDHLTPKKKQKIRFFVNMLECNEKKHIGKIAHSRKLPGINRYKVARRLKSGGHVIMDYFPLEEKLGIFSRNGFYSRTSRNIIHFFLENNAANLLQLWRENELIEND